jgi:hypothetical protein
MIRISPSFFSKLFFSCLFAIITITTSQILWGFNITSDGLDIVGPPLVAYSISRIALVFILLSSAFSAGTLTLKAISPHPIDSFVGTSRHLVVILLIGITTISFVMVALGFSKLYFKPVALTIALSLTMAAPFLWNSHVLKTAPFVPKGVLTWLWIQLPFLILIILTCICFAALLSNRALFIGEADNDVWEHYLHYYDLVLKSHSIWPNELWVHFFVSKAAGLFFLAALLGDTFSVQTASMVGALLIAFISYSLVYGATGNRMAGLASAALVLASWNGLEGQAGSFLKHHTIVASLICGVFWCALEAIKEKERVVRRLFIISGASAALYLGFYITVTAPFVASGLALTSLTLFLLNGSLRRILPALAIGFACVCGATAALLVNYLVTGLALDAPVNLFWPLADVDRFKTIWNPLVIEYWFLGPASPESSKITLNELLTIDQHWWLRLLRENYIRPLSMPIFLLAIVSLIVKLLRKYYLKVNEPAKFDYTTSVGILAFLLGTLIIAQAFKNSESVYRLYTFTLGLSIPLLVIFCWQTTLGIFRRNEWSLWLITMVSVIGCFGLIRQVPIERWATVGQFVSGSISTKDSLHYAELSFPRRVSIDDMISFRALYPDKHRLMFLTYDPSPAYFVPTPPIVSEPSYAFDRSYEVLLFGGIDASKQILYDLDISYFAFNLNNRLFLGLPYSPLFSEDQISKHFGLAWSKDDIYILGWRDHGIINPLPEKLLEILKAKKSGEIPIDAESRWGPRLTNQLRNSPSTRDQNSAFFEWLYNDMLVNQLSD